MSAIPPPPAWPPAPVGPPPPAPAPRQPPRYSRFSALVLSFFSMDLYRDVGRNWRGIGLLYLLLLFALTWLPPVIRGHIGFRRFVRNDAPAVLSQVPSVTIKNGVVSIKEPEPYIVRDPQTGRTILYVDTSGEFNQEKEAREAAVLLSRSTVEIRQPNKTEVHDLSQIDSLYVDKEVVRRWMERAATVFGPVAYVGGVIGSLLWGLVRLLIYGLIGMIIASAQNARLDLAALMRISAVAITPAMAIDTLAWTFNFGYLPCCGWSILMAVITVIYVGVGVRANAEAMPPTGVYGGFPYQPSFTPYPPAPAPPQYPYPPR
jgi:hypothetical protein